MSLKKFKQNLKKYIPALITGGADNDPSGIATYSISGARFGFGQLWLMVLATPMLVAVQGMCSRLADVRRQGLSHILKEEFGVLVAWISAGIIIVANTVTIGADILAVSLAFELITGIGLKYWVLPITIIIWYVVLFKDYKTISKYLAWLLVFFVFYAVAAILAGPNWGLVLKNMFVPNLTGVGREYYIAAVAVLGTTITPYLFFWQVKEQLEEKKTVAAALKDAPHEDRINAPGFIFSQSITIFIMIAAALSLSSGDGIKTAADAARALEPVAGRFATIIFSLGIIGAGLLAIPVLAVSTATVVAETVGFKHEGLSNKIKSAKGFYAVITLSLLAGAAILIIGIDPLSALYYSQVLAGVLAPFLILLILIVCNRRRVMGEYSNGWFDNFFGTLAFIVMLGTSILMFLS